jgi:hypothetical protein
MDLVCGDDAPQHDRHETEQEKPDPRQGDAGA